MDIVSFIITMLVAMAAENAIFAKGLGTSKMLFEIESISTTIKFGGMITLITTLSSLISFNINNFTRAFDMRIYHRGILFCIAVCIVYGIVCTIMRSIDLKMFRRYRLMLAIASFNSSVHGALVLAAMRNLNLFDTIAYALGSGIGFTIALILIYNCKQRLLIANIPQTFRGLPITLIYIGILSLAIYGLIGYQLPS